MSDRAPRVAGDSGETLVELLVAIVIMGITGAAIMGGLLASVHFSDVHRKQSTAGAYARDYGEAVDRFVAGGGYVECADTSAYTPAAVGFSTPTGFSAAVTSVTYWDRAARRFGATCSSSGLEQVTVQVTSADGRATERSVIVVREP